MFKDILVKSNININAMLTHGSVAVITMLGIGIFFGIENIMMAFPIALTSIVLSRQNLHIKTLSKAFRIILLDVTIVSLAYLASINIFIGIFINLITIFLIIYTVISPYDMAFYKPFIMLYVFTQYNRGDINEFILKILAVIFGVFVVVVIGALIIRDNEKSFLGRNISKSLKLILSQLENIQNSSFDNSITSKCSGVTRDLAYRIYISRHKKYLMTYVGRLEFSLYLDIEYLNIFLEKLNKGNINKEFYSDEIKYIKKITEQFILYCEKKISISDLEKEFDIFNLYMKSSDSESIEKVVNILNDILKSFNQIDKLSRRERNKVYKRWRRSDIDRVRLTFKEYLKPNTIRFKFAMRMSITLTFSLFLAEFLGFYKIIWALITIMSIMQPYYEDTVVRSKDRIRGNIIAIIFTGIIINIVNAKIFTIFILVCSVYLIYAFKEYYKLSLFAAIASICVSSISTNINELIILRVIYVLIGVGIVIIANKTIFPYRLKDGIRQLMSKIMRLNNIFTYDVLGYVTGKNNAHRVRDIIIHSTLLCQKLSLRNAQYNDDNVKKFIDINNRFIVEMGYLLLQEYKYKR